MLTQRTLSGLACRAAAFTVLFAGAASLTQAQSASSAAPSFQPLFAASAYANPFGSNLASGSSSSSSSSAEDMATLDSTASFGHFDLAARQPPPRRTYGRPNYSDNNTNADGSPKWTFLVGAGLALPVGDTHFYETTGWGFQGGGGRNFSKVMGVMLQFDYDHFGLQGATLANQTTVYNTILACTPAQVSAGQCISGLDGNNHVWSFTVDPTFTVPTEGSLGAYVVVGAGFYHKVTNFTEPTPEEECSIYFGCGEFTVAANIDHYTSNAFGANGGLGATWKFSKFSNERLFAEVRYVFVDNQPRSGVTVQNAATAPTTATNFYPANSHRTTYFPVKFGLRF